MSSDASTPPLPFEPWFPVGLNTLHSKARRLARFLQFFTPSDSTLANVLFVCMCRAFKYMQPCLHKAQRRRQRRWTRLPEYPKELAGKRMLSSMLLLPITNLHILYRRLSLLRGHCSTLTVRASHDKSHPQPRCLVLVVSPATVIVGR